MKTLTALTALTAATMLMTAPAMAADTWPIPVRTKAPEPARIAHDTHCANYTFVATNGGTITADCLNKDGAITQVKMDLPGIVFDKGALVFMDTSFTLTRHCGGLTVTPVADGLKIAGRCKQEGRPFIAAEITVPGLQEQMTAAAY